MKLLFDRTAPFYDLDLDNKKASENQKMDIDFGFRVSISPFTEFSEEDTRRNFTAGMTYFHAEERSANPSKAGEPWIWVNVQEHFGHLVGIHWFLKTPANTTTQGVQEGNHLIYVDGLRSPQVHSTGFEDLFNTAHSFLSESHTHGMVRGFGLPFHGSPYHWKQSRPDTLAEFQAYRYFVADYIPFQKSLVGYWECGVHASITNYLSLMLNTVTFYYGRNTKGLVHSDSLRVSVERSEVSHSYSPCIDSVPTIYSYRGVWHGVWQFKTLHSNSTGRRFPLSQSKLQRDSNISDINLKHCTSFKMKIEINNVGVQLRRSYDNKKGGQGAFVFIDEAFVGKWYLAQKDGRYSFVERMFLLPTSETVGKSKILIHICPFGKEWNEFEYQTWSLIM